MFHKAKIMPMNGEEEEGERKEERKKEPYIEYKKEIGGGKNEEEEEQQERNKRIIGKYLEEEKEREKRRGINGKKSPTLIIENDDKTYDAYANENNEFFRKYNIKTPKWGERRSKTSMERPKDISIDPQNMKTPTTQRYSTVESPLINRKQQHDDELEKMVEEAKRIRKQRQAEQKLKEYKQKALDMEMATSPLLKDRPFSGAITEFEREKVSLSRNSSRPKLEWINSQKDLKTPQDLHAYTPSLEPVAASPNNNVKETTIPKPLQEEDQLQMVNFVVNTPATTEQGEVEMEEVQYIPLEVAKEKIMTILKDWTQMKISYVQSLEKLRERYEAYDAKDEENYREFIERFKEKYGKLKGKFNAKRRQLKKLTYEIERLNETNMMLRTTDKDGSMEEMVIEQIALKQKVAIQKKLYFGLSQYLKTIEEKMVTLQNELAEKEEVIGNHESTIEAMDADTIKAKIQTLKVEKSQLDDKIILRDQAIEELKGEIEKVTEFAKEQSMKVKELESEMETMQKEFEEREMTIEKSEIATPSHIMLNDDQPTPFQQAAEDVPENKVELEALQRQLNVEKQMVVRLKDEIEALKKSLERMTLKSVQSEESLVSDNQEDLTEALATSKRQVKEEREEVKRLLKKMEMMERNVLDTEEMMEIQRKLIEKDALLSEAQKQFKKLQSAFLSLKEQLEASNEATNVLKEQLERSTSTSTNATKELKKLADENEALHQTESKNLAQLEDQQALIHSLKNDKQKLRDAVEALKPAAARAATLKKALKKFSVKYEALTQAHEKLQEDHENLQASTHDITTLRETNKALEIESKEALKKSHAAIKKKEDYKKQLAKEQSLRRKYYNKLEDAKGKVRVYCRVRPFSKKETEANYATTIKPIDDASFKLIQKDKDWEFSKVFYEEATQREVFADTNDLIQSVFDGYNVCVFAYGQTGSGKTYTISGVPDNEQLAGILPRSIQSIFKRVEKQSKLYETKIVSSMIELYLDEIYDLYTKVKKKRDLPDYAIKKDRHGNVIVTNVELKEASSAEELFNHYSKALVKRHVRETNMNAESSRSHLIFSIHIESKNRTNGETTYGKLSLVDLAGSEKLSKTGVDEVGAREAVAINKSLSALKDVIIALCGKGAFIPYRSNKLTMLLSDSLGGVAKTLMFVNVGPAEYNLEETNNSLQYADRVKDIKNTITRSSETKKVKKVMKKLKKLEELVAYLKENGGKMPTDSSF